MNTIKDASMLKSTCVFSGSAHPELAQQIAGYLDLPLGRCRTPRFSDGEVFAEIQENVRGVDTYVVQPTCSPVNDSVMELLIMVDALRRASAGSITAVIPYFGYARQDRKVAPRTPITSKLVADLIVAAGVDRIVAVDLHAPRARLGAAQLVLVHGAEPRDGALHEAPGDAEHHRPDLPRLHGRGRLLGEALLEHADLMTQVATEPKVACVVRPREEPTVRLKGEP